MKKRRLPKHRVAAPGPRHRKAPGFLAKFSAGSASVAVSGLLALGLLDPALGGDGCQTSSNIVGNTTTVTIADPTTCPWQVPAGVDEIEIAIVAGGGGGGGGVASGGGAGQVLYNPSLAVIPGAIFSVSVGQGGLGATYDANTYSFSRATNGGKTVFGSFEAIGGGSGAGEADRMSSEASSRNWLARVGGSGGGSSASNQGPNSTQNSYAGWQSFGNSGGSGTGVSFPNGYVGGTGGGGGAGTAGGDPQVDNVVKTITDGRGGNGIYLLGSCLATGGAGLTANGYAWGDTSSYFLSAAQASCQRPNGEIVAGTAVGSIKNVPPVANTGSGGSVTTTDAKNGLNGSNGVVLIKYSTSQTFTVAPTPNIIGVVEVGRIVSTSPGAWSDNPTLTYQWSSNGSPISGATNNSYTIQSTDVGTALTVTATATAPGFTTATRTSSPTVVMPFSTRLTLSGPPVHNSRELEFTLTGEASLDCTTLSADDFVVSKLQITRIVGGRNSISCSIWVKYTDRPETSIAATLSAAVNFSIKDASGASINQIATGSSASTIFTAKPIYVNSLSGVRPNSFSDTKPTNFLSGLDSGTQAALLDKGLVPATDAIEKKIVVIDLTGVGINDSISEKTNNLTINTGEAIKFQFQLPNAFVTAKDVVGFVEIGGEWKYLGRTAATSTLSTSGLAIAENSNLVFKIALVDKSSLINVASASVSPLRAAKVGSTNSSGSTDSTTRIVKTSVNPSTISSLGQYVFTTNVTVTGSAIPIVQSATPTPAPVHTVAPAPVQTVSPAPVQTLAPTPTPTSSASPAPTVRPTPVASQSPSPTAQTPIQVVQPSTQPTPVSPTLEPAAPTPLPSSTQAAAQETAQPSAASETIAAPVAIISDVIGSVIENLQIGTPEANPAIGATGDDDAPQVAFDPMGTEESVEAVTRTVVEGVVIASGLAAAAAAAGAAGAAAAGAVGFGVGAPTRTTTSFGSGTGSSVSSSANNSIANSADSEIHALERLEVSHDGFRYGKSNWGDRLSIFKFAAVTAIDLIARRFSERISYFSPLLAKAGNDASYLRAMFGSFTLLVPFFAIYVALQALSITTGQITTPPWVMLLTITFLGAFDVMAGLLGSLVFVVGTIVFASSPLGMADYRLLGGIVAVSIAPMIVASAFRKIRKLPANNFGTWWERITDLAIIPFMSGWTVSSMVSMLPAIFGTTLSVANHVNDFAIAIALAAFARVILEEFSARYFPERLNRVNPDELPEPPLVQKVISLLVKYSIWVFISGALLGVSWQIWVGSALFLVPTIVSWFSSKLPNLPSLWRVWPTGIPGLVANLAISGATTTTVSILLGSTPDFAKWSFLLLGLPALVFSLVGQLARHGESPDEIKPAKRSGVIYRVGGALFLIISLKLTGIL